MLEYVLCNDTAGQEKRTTSFVQEEEKKANMGGKFSWFKIDVYV